MDVHGQSHSGQTVQASEWLWLIMTIEYNFSGCMNNNEEYIYSTITAS